MNKNQYIAVITDGENVIGEHQCTRLEIRNGFDGTVIMGIPETGVIGWETPIATVPNNFIVVLTEKKEDEPTPNNNI